LMDYLERNPRDPARENQFSAASGADRNARSMRGIPETPNGSRGPDPLMNYTLRPEDMITVKKLGEGSAGTVSKVKHVPTGFVMARKVCCSLLLMKTCPVFIVWPAPVLIRTLPCVVPLLFLSLAVTIRSLVFCSCLLELTPLSLFFTFPFHAFLPFIWSARLFLIC
jgi:hypothetical protein